MDQVGNEEVVENSNTMKQPSKTKRSRGSTILPSVIKDRNAGVQKTLKYNDNGQPIGNEASKYSSYLGVLARSMVPISYKSWHLSAKDIERKIVELCGAYNVDPKSKKKTITAIGVCWRNFKNTLTNEILANKSDLTFLSKPPMIYSFITQSDWDSFVKLRLSEEFKRLSDLQKERRGQYVYNHRLSRKGYAQLGEEMKISTGSNDDIDRCILWKKARQNKKGEYDSEAIMQQIEKIDELQNKSKDGTVSTQGTNDILSMELGKPEYSGRVRGVEHYVTPTSYFHVLRRSNHSSCDAMHRSLREKLEQLQVQINAMAQQPPHTPQSDYVSSNTLKSDNRGCPQLDPKNDDACPKQLDPEPTKKKVVNKDGLSSSKPCSLAIRSANNIVAHGTMYERIRPEEKNSHDAIRRILFACGHQ